MGSRPSSPFPTIHEATTFIQSHLPLKPNDVSPVYHRPFSPSFSPTQFTVRSIVLSITPTPGFYSALNAGAKLGFLHRPWALERRRVPRNVNILANHKGFDEALTTGWNVPLARRLGLDVDAANCIQGYKGDLERRIGIVAPLVAGSVDAGVMKARVLAEFDGDVEGCFGFEGEGEEGVSEEGVIESQLSTIAIMNAFHPDEVDRVLDAALEIGALESREDASSVLYLTGAVREAGLLYAREKGMKVICVGHRVCEEWGIRYLASEIRHRYPSLQVNEIYEPGEPREKLAVAQAPVIVEAAATPLPP